MKSRFSPTYKSSMEEEYCRARNAVTFSKQEGLSVKVAEAVLRFVCRKYGISQ